MNLLSLLEHLEYKCLQGSTEQEVSSVVYDSRKVEEGSLFICIRGAVVDGHKFIPDVVAKGAKTLIVEEAVEAPEDVTVIQVEDTRYAVYHAKCPAVQWEILCVWNWAADAGEKQDFQ